MMKNRKGLRWVQVLVTAQTLWNLKKMDGMDGYGELGCMVDKLVRVLI